EIHRLRVAIRWPTAFQNTGSSGRQSRSTGPSGVARPATDFSRTVIGHSPWARARAGTPEPMTGVLRISLKYIQMRETQTTPYSSMKAEDRTPVRSTRTPKRMGRMKPPRPPARPTMPEMAPMLWGYSSEMYLNTEALPNAQAMPTTNISAVNTHSLRPRWKVVGPLTVWMVNAVCG